MIQKFKTEDHPSANGRLPEPGERQWTLTFPLEGTDDYLEVCIGKRGHDALIKMLVDELSDDAKERIAAKGYSGAD